MVQTAVFDAQGDENSLIAQLTVPAFTADVWRSAWIDATKYRRLTLLLAMDQASAADGVLIEQSGSTAVPTDDTGAHEYTEASTVQRTNPVTAVAYHARGMTVERIGLWVRLVVKHAGVAPTTFVARLIGVGIT